MIQPSYRRVSPLRLVSEEIFAFLIWATICLVILLIFDYYNAICWTIIGILSFIYLLISCIYLPLLCLKTSYCLDERFLRYRTGLFYSKDEIIYKDRIIYVTLVKTPLSPILKIAAVVIRAPGATVMLRGIKLTEAKRLVRQLSAENDYKGGNNGISTRTPY